MTAWTIPQGHYRFRHVAGMEWIKLRSLRSAWWTLGITVAGAIAIGVAVGLNTKNASADLTNNALAGMVPGLLLAGVLGVLVMTSEYTSGMIRATPAAIPDRPLLLAAKAAVFAPCRWPPGRPPRSFRSSREERRCRAACRLPRSASPVCCARCCCPGRAFA